MLLDLKGPGFLPLITEDCAYLLQRAGVRPEDRRLSLLQVSRIYGLDHMLPVPKSLDMLLWRWQFAVHEAAHAVVAYGLGHHPTYLTIRPTRDYLGLCVHEPISTAKEITPRTRCRDRHLAFRGSIDEALIALAGPIAGCTPIRSLTSALAIWFNIVSTVVRMAAGRSLPASSLRWETRGCRLGACRG